MVPLYVVGIYIWKLNRLLEGFYSKYLLENHLHLGTLRLWNAVELREPQCQPSCEGLSFSKQ